MIERVDEMIANDVEDPLKMLDKNRHRQRGAKRSSSESKKGKVNPKPLSIQHPQLGVWKGVRDRLSEVSEANDSEEI